MNAAPYQVRTHNASTESENRMHSDDVARQFGFKGGLVPGVTVFSHMTRPMVARYGEAWLARGTAEVTFGKPAYEGELLTINTADNNDASHTLTCLNEQGVELARMSAALPLATTKPDARSNRARPATGRTAHGHLGFNGHQPTLPRPRLVAHTRRKFRLVR